MGNWYTSKYSNKSDRALAMAKLIKERQVAKSTKKLNTTKDKKDDKGNS